MTHTPTQERDWEKEFDERFGVICDNVIPFSEQYNADTHKDFIRETLQQDRAYLAGEVEKLIALEKYTGAHPDTKQALEDVLTIINGSK